MAAVNSTAGAGRKASGGRRRRGSMPVKRTINLAALEMKSLDLRIAIPAIILIIAAAFLFGKFAVADRLIAVSRAEGEVAQERSRLDAAYRRLDHFGELSDLYAHYTFSGMTDEELHRADRSDVLNLMRDVILPSVTVDSFALKENLLTVNMTGESLQVINRTVQEIEKEEIVSFCAVNNAKTNEVTRSIQRGDITEELVETSVTAQVLVYLNPDEGVDRR